jgi:hypothetical protein
MHFIICTVSSLFSCQCTFSNLGGEGEGLQEVWEVHDLPDRRALQGVGVA